MLRTLLNQLQRSFNYVWLIVLAGYIAVLAGQAFMRNYSSQKDTDTLVRQLHVMQQERQRLESLVVYYKTDAYKEKELRRDLLLVRPDERVFALPESGNPRSLEEEITRQSESGADTGGTTGTDTTSPSWRVWVDYLLHKS